MLTLIIRCIPNKLMNKLVEIKEVAVVNNKAVYIQVQQLLNHQHKLTIKNKAIRMTMVIILISTVL